MRDSRVVPPFFFRRVVLAAALGLAAAAPLAAQGYGPTLVEAEQVRMHRGDTLDLDIGKAFDWAEVEGEAVAAFMREGNSLRLVAIRTGTAQVVLTANKQVVWRAEVFVR
jgi:hypothetical protein